MARVNYDVDQPGTGRQMSATVATVGKLHEGTPR